eukprot:3554170-Rhodomonas_salina.3
MVSPLAVLTCSRRSAQEATQKWSRWRTCPLRRCSCGTRVMSATIFMPLSHAPQVDQRRMRAITSRAQQGWMWGGGTYVHQTHSESVSHSISTLWRLHLGSMGAAVSSITSSSKKSSMIDRASPCKTNQESEPEKTCTR